MFRFNLNVDLALLAKVKAECDTTFIQGALHI